MSELYREIITDLLNGTVDNPESVENLVPDTVGQGLNRVQPIDEPTMSIDVKTREITIPEELVNICVVGDHLSETVFFEMPRFADGLDLSEHKCKVCVINAGKEYVECDTTIASMSTNSLKIGWTIDNKVSRYSGDINFTVQFDTIDSHGIAYQWSTIPATIHVMAGLDIDKVLPPKDDSLYVALSNRVTNLETQLATLMSIINTLNLESRLNTLETDVNFLRNNAVLKVASVPEYI